MTEQTRCAATVESKLKVYSFFGGVRLDETPHEPCNQPIRQKADGEWEHEGDCGTCGHFEVHHGDDGLGGYCFTCIDWNPASRRCISFVPTTSEKGHRATPPVEEAV